MKLGWGRTHSSAPRAQRAWIAGTERDRSVLLALFSAWLEFAGRTARATPKTAPIVVQNRFAGRFRLVNLTIHVSIYVMSLNGLDAGQARPAKSFERLLRGQAGRKTGRRTGAKEFKSEMAKRLGWRLREALSRQAPCCLFCLPIEVPGLFRFYTRFKFIQ